MEIREGFVEQTAVIVKESVSERVGCRYSRSSTRRKEDDMETNFIWKERKRNALGLPWTFTKYALTGDRLFITRGLLKTV